jgi:DNA mismatch repair protein MutS
MAKTSSDDTPVMRQFKTAKAQCPDALLFFRMGDFYELFFDDAVTAARALDLTLTSRNKGAMDSIPMAGVPHHAAAAYVQRLLEQGFRVAICEQMADPATVKGIVPRSIVRVATPGIPFDDTSLDPKENIFLAGVTGTSPYGLAALDLTTAEAFAVECADEHALLSELVRFSPREILLAPECVGVATLAQRVLPRAFVREEQGGDSAPVEGVTKAALGTLRGTAQVEGAEVLTSKLALQAIERVLRLVALSEPLAAPRRFRLAGQHEALLLDEAAQRHLELVRTFDGDKRGALLHTLDETCTASGARLLRRWLLRPLANVAQIRRRHDQVEAFVSHPRMRQECRERLSEVADLERLCVRLETDRIGPKDLRLLLRTLDALPALVTCLGSVKEESLEVLIPEPAHTAATLLRRALADDPPLRATEAGIFRGGFDAELDAARALLSGGQEHLAALETRLKDETGAPTLKIRYTRVFGWYVEVSRAQATRVPSAWRRKQTVATGERFTTPELDALAEKIGRAEGTALAREGELYRELLTELRTHLALFRQNAACVAALDVTQSFAEVAHRADYCRPEVDASLELIIEDGRHPVVERMAGFGKFVPNDCTLVAGGACLWLVTGPNMAGKSTFMRQNALIVLLAHVGSFVPAKRARIGLVDRILTRVGASDSLARGESTFMVEMRETAAVLEMATQRSLVVLDEIGRGTSTYDGLAIASAVTEHLATRVLCRALFATHYHELTELAKAHPSIVNVSVSAREHEGSLVFVHSVEHGAASRSYGVACARLAGLPTSVLLRAEHVLAQLEEAPIARSPRAEAQMTLEFPAETPLRDALAQVKLDRLTPLEALNLLSLWQKEFVLSSRKST